MEVVAPIRLNPTHRGYPGLLCGSDNRYPWEGSGPENEGAASWELLHRPKRIFRTPKDQGKRRGTGRPTLEVVRFTSPGAREIFEMSL